MTPRERENLERAKNRLTPQQKARAHIFLKAFGEFMAEVGSAGGTPDDETRAILVAKLRDSMEIGGGGIMSPEARRVGEWLAGFILEVMGGVPQ